ncbi:bpX6 domain-containing protein [Pseudomonas extremaustralis]|uniref:bpX6 domain-containing protein n=1 Tax=Pseudomonas extremaustralis TaxID=359110 RepID=UPI002AA825E4|nr:bpX6 domain-containing protein [Pseudomonas extremaustralis]
MPNLLVPGQWLDISMYTLLDTFDCHAPLVARLPEPVVTDVREILGGHLEPVSPEREGVMQALIERQRNAPKRPPAAAASPAGDPWAAHEPSSFPALKLGATMALLAAFVWMATQGQPVPSSPIPAERRESFSGVILATLLGAVFFTGLLMGLNPLPAPPPGDNAGRAGRRDGTRRCTACRGTSPQACRLAPLADPPDREFTAVQVVRQASGRLLCGACWRCSRTVTLKRPCATPSL